MGASLEWSARTRRSDDRLPLRGAACIIEPNELDRDNIGVLLHNMGYTAHETASGALSLFIAEQIRLQVIIVNIMLPDTKGPKLIRRLRERAPDAVIIALSPHQPTDLPSALARFAGADAVVGSPPCSESLCYAISEAREKHLHDAPPHPVARSRPNADAARP